MKYLIFLCSFFIYSNLSAQLADCDCSAALNVALKNNSNSYNSNQVKKWFFNYFSISESDRADYKKTAKSSWGLDAVIKSVPISFNTNSSNGNSKSSYKTIEKEVQGEGYFSDEHLAILVSSTFSTNQLEAYKECIGLCKGNIKRNDGVYSVVGGDEMDIFYITIVYDEQVGNATLTLESDADYVNCEPINGLVFEKGLTIQDGKSVTQYFKRTSAKKFTSVTVRFKDNVSSITTDITGNNSAKDQTPVGTIIASYLSYSQFCRVNGLDESLSINSVWVPCDGRTISRSKYAKSGYTNAPDLRGVFLRGANVMYENNAGAASARKKQLNPSNKLVGEFQNDAIQKHEHIVGRVKTDKQSVSQYDKDRFADFSTHVDVKDPHTTSGIKKDNKTRISSETRPKNITIYYYIKIN